MALHNAIDVEAAQPLRVDLFGVSTFQTGRDKPRKANDEEVRAYLLDLARWHGVSIPKDATFGPSGIHSPKHGCVLAMPGYGQDRTVIVQELDEAGNVVRTSRIGVNDRGQIGLSADTVRKIAALPKVRKSRAADTAPLKPAQPVSEPEAPAAPVMTEIAPSAPPALEFAPTAPEPAEPTPAERLERAVVGAMAALEPLAIVGEPGRDPRTVRIWEQFCSTALGLPLDGWEFTQGKQRDRKARNRGKAVVSADSYLALVAAFNDLGTTAAPIVDQPPVTVAPAVALPKDCEPKDSALSDQLAALAARVAQLERGQPLQGKRQRTEGERRAILRAWRMRAERNRARDQRDRYLIELDQAGQARVSADQARRITETRLEMLRDRRTGTATRIVRARHAAAQVRQALTIAEATRERLVQDAQGLRAEVERLAPIAAAITALTQPQRPYLAAVA